ncbi:hypothetical protein BSL78_20590 [Apostichopus japonicus]|uniref:Uncharacterized protein n=1 Tax=Stichopus japonicus TaxID=307972 RepID=A0A2G8K3M6_STIJA|nr:hypothetical protein BSL78_20590 [Apostichopus japonicus]
MFAIRILSMTDSCEKTRQMLTRAEDTSNLQTEAEDAEANGKRKRRANRRYDTSSDDDYFPRPTGSAALSTPASPLPAIRVSQSQKRLAQPPPVQTSPVSPPSFPSGSGLLNHVPRTTPVSGRVGPMQRTQAVISVGEVRELKNAVQQLHNRNDLPLREEEFVFPEEVVLPVTDLWALDRLEEEQKTNKALWIHLVCIFQLLFS